MTEQNPAGLGPTIPELAELMPTVERIPKFSFYRRPSIATGTKVSITGNGCNDTVNINFTNPMIIIFGYIQIALIICGQTHRTV